MTDPNDKMAVVYQAALAYIEAGLSVIPIAADGTKSPARSLLPKAWCEESHRLKSTWKPYQERRPTAEEITVWFATPRFMTTFGVAAVCGGVSGGLEVIDLDNIATVEPWVNAVNVRAPGLLEQLVLVQTPRPGLHAYFRSSACGRSTKLARTIVPDRETGKPERKTLIEIKGEGGYAVIPPSPTEVHLSGRPYIYLAGRDLTQVGMITPDERAVLIAAATALDSVPSEPKRLVNSSVKPCSNLNRDKPGDDFNARASWDQVLAPYGWVLTDVDGTGVAYWRRPGKSFGISATTNYGDSDLLYVFSENAAPFEANQGYTKFAAYTLLAHRGNYRVAARVLTARGFGAHGRRRGVAGQVSPSSH